MKKVITITLVWLAILKANAQIDTIYTIDLDEFYKSYKTYYVGHLQNKIKVGEWKSYNERWQLLEAGSYKKQIKQDHYTKYTEEKYFTMKGKEVPVYENAKSGVWTEFDETGKVANVRYESVNIEDFKSGNKWGFINQSGKIIIPPKYDETKRQVSETFFRVRMGNKWGFISGFTAKELPILYDALESFHEGIACVKLNGKWGCIDTSGKEIVPFKYDEMNYFINGFVWAKSGEKYGVVNRNGEEVSPFKYDKIYNFTDMLMWVTLGEKYGVADNTGKEIIAPIYEGIYKMYRQGVWVKLGEKCVFVSKNGSVMSAKYDKFEEFSGVGIAKVMSGGKYGFIDETGYEIIPTIYDYANSFTGEKVRVEQNGVSFYINRKGEKVE